MLRIALQSVAHHRGALLATGIVGLVGTALVASMAAVLATGTAATTAVADRAFLTQFPLILGGWIVAIVLFAVVSTVGVGLEGRSGEVTGMLLVGASPVQVRRMVALETAAVTTVAAIPGVGAGYLLGAGIVGQVTASGLIDPASRYAPGVLLPVLAGALIVVASVLGGHLGAKQMAGRSPVGGPTTAKAARPRGRRLAALACLVVGAGTSATALAMEPGSVYTTAATGPGCVLVAVGLSLLAREQLAVANGVLSVLRFGRRSASSHVARINLRTVPERVRPVITFVTLFVGVCSGTLAMQGIEDRVNAGSDGIAVVLASINYLVVILIAAFMAIALTNNLIATITRRTGEFGVMSLVGATGAHVRRMLVAEVSVATAVSVATGVIGAAVAVLPFALVKTGDAAQAVAPVPYLATVVAATLLTLGVTHLVGRKVSQE